MDPASLTILYQTGVAGVFLVLFVLDRICTPSERNRLRIENKELREANDLLNRNIREDVVPALTKNIEVNKQVADLLAARMRPLTGGD